MGHKASYQHLGCYSRRMLYTAIKSLQDVKSMWFIFIIILTYYKFTDYCLKKKSDESAGRYKIQGENTFTNFEYEQWKYPNYNNGKGYFWFLRHPSDTQHSVYEINNSSEYHDDLMAFKDAVETINTTEISVGFSVALGVGSVVTIGLKGAALLMALDAYLDSNDVPTGVSNVIEWEEAVEEAQACWLRLFY